MNSSADTSAHSKDALLAGLNEQQFEAVTMADEDVIILAGAGSGKTKVLTSRMVWLIRQGRAQPKEILAVTFTNKAAKEMKDRLGKMITVPTGNLWVGTFHGLCHRMLRENTALAGLPPGFSIMDEDDQLAMVKRMLKDMKETTGVPDDIEPRPLQKFINKMKEQGVRASRAVPNNDFEGFAVPFYASYEALCARQGTIDFAELQLRVCEMLQTNQQFLEKYQNRFSHILVDEFQDTNLMQYDWLKTIRGDRASIFAVGDDDQSIYGFRGSNPDNMTDFVSEIANGRVVRLEQNYRSTGNILSAANALIDCNSGRMGKNLWTDAGDGTRMKVMHFARDFEEAEQVAVEIKNMINRGEDPDQIAILYRSNHQSRGYEKALMSRGIPYTIYGGTRFFERMEIKNVLAYLRLAINLTDDVAARRVINLPSRGIGETTIDKISEIAHAQDMPFLAAATSVYDGKAKDKILGFVELMSDIIDASNTKTLAEFIDYTIAKTGLREFYEKNKDDEDRLRNLGELLSAAKSFCFETDIADAAQLPACDILAEFLASASLESALDKPNEADPDVKEKPKAVTLMTVHAAKGLEFNNVVIGGAEEGMFPSEISIDEGNEEEERRLMYVAITRARKNLLVSTCAGRFVHGKPKELTPSRFLGEIPATLMDQKRFASNYWSAKMGDRKNDKAAAKPASSSNPFSDPAPTAHAQPAQPSEDRIAESRARHAAQAVNEASQADHDIAVTERPEAQDSASATSRPTGFRRLRR